LAQTKFRKLTFNKSDLLIAGDYLIPGDYLVKLLERMPRVCKAFIKAKAGYIEESQI
jgi:hypothetical protein